jgi:hypothetical protein
MGHDHAARGLINVDNQPKDKKLNRMNVPIDAGCTILFKKTTMYKKNQKEIPAGGVQARFNRPFANGRHCVSPFS